MPQKQPQKLSGVTLDEVSLVDVGANAKAKVLLAKREAVEKQPTASDVHVNVPMGGRKKRKLAKVSGVKFTLGFPKDGGSRVQSVLFASDKWDKEKATAWLKEHDLKGGEPDETENYLRYRQEEPSKFERFRVVTPGASTSKAMASVTKALNAEDSWNTVQTLVSNALREEYGPKGSAEAPYIGGPWIRDFFNDYVIYDDNGQICRIEYEINEDDNGENTVSFIGSPEYCDTFYLTESEAKGLGIDDEEPANNELQKRFKLLQGKASALLNKGGCK